MMKNTSFSDQLSLEVLKIWIENITERTYAEVFLRMMLDILMNRD